MTAPRHPGYDEPMGQVIPMHVDAQGNALPAAARPRPPAPAGPWGLGTGSAAAALVSVFLSADPNTPRWAKLLGPLVVGGAIGGATYLVLAFRASGPGRRPTATAW